MCQNETSSCLHYVRRDNGSFSKLYDASWYNLCGNTGGETGEVLLYHQVVSLLFEICPRYCITRDCLYHTKTYIVPTLTKYKFSF